jgi:hypothetical protein
MLAVHPPGATTPAELIVKLWFMATLTIYSVQANEDVLLMELLMVRVGSVGVSVRMDSPKAPKLDWCPVKSTV